MIERYLIYTLRSFRTSELRRYVPTSSTMDRSPSAGEPAGATGDRHGEGGSAPVAPAVVSGPVGEHPAHGADRHVGASVGDEARPAFAADDTLADLQPVIEDDEVSARVTLGFESTNVPPAGRTV